MAFQVWGTSTAISVRSGPQKVQPLFREILLRMLHLLTCALPGAQYAVFFAQHHGGCCAYSRMITIYNLTFRPQNNNRFFTSGQKCDLSGFDLPINLCKICASSTKSSQTLCRPNGGGGVRGQGFSFIQ